MKAFYGTKLILAEPQGKAMNEGEEAQEGYKVQYPDGYISWSPKKAFEDSYQPMNALSFGHALIALRDGKRVARSGWNGAGQYLQLQVPDDNSKMRHPYIYISPVDGRFVPWVASQTDMLANDWKIVE